VILDRKSATNFTWLVSTLIYAKSRCLLHVDLEINKPHYRRVAMESTIAEIFENVIKGDRAAVEETVHKAIDAGLPAQEILNEGLIKLP
jgi:hypothetical protein